MNRPKPGSIFLLTPSGHGNLGDAAIQDAVIAELRCRFAGAQIIVASLNPRDTEQRHGVPAFPLTALSRPGYDVVLPDQGSGRPLSQPARPHRAGRVVLDSIKAVLPKGLPWLIRSQFAKVRAELVHFVRVLRVLKGASYVVVSGGGQLDEFWGGPWGHPYSLFKWSLLGRLRGAKVVFLSVGFGTLHSATARFLTRRALALACYRSYRDAGSKVLLQSMGFANDDAVYPDLAYGTPSPTLMRAPSRTDAVKRIGVSPIIYCDPRTWPRKSMDIYQGYLKRLAEVSAWLMQCGHDIVLLTSDRPDMRAASDLMGLLEPVHRGQRVSLETPDTSSVSTFLQVAASVDIVVASRLHGVLLSHVAYAPTIALSYERKVSTLMDSLGQSHLCLDIETFMLGDFQMAFQRLTEEGDSLRDSLRSTVDIFREQLREQYNIALSG